MITGDVTDITVTLDDIPEADVQHQLRDGLKLMNVLSIMQSHKDIMKKYFVHDEDSALTAGVIFLLESY